MCGLRNTLDQRYRKVDLYTPRNLSRYLKPSYVENEIEINLSGQLYTQENPRLILSILSEHLLRRRKALWNPPLFYMYSSAFFLSSSRTLMSVSLMYWCCAELHGFPQDRRVHLLTTARMCANIFSFWLLNLRIWPQDGINDSLLLQDKVFQMSNLWTSPYFGYCNRPPLRYDCENRKSFPIFFPAFVKSIFEPSSLPYGTHVSGDIERWTAIPSSFLPCSHLRVIRKIYSSPVLVTIFSL